MRILQAIFNMVRTYFALLVVFAVVSAALTED